MHLPRATVPEVFNRDLSLGFGDESPRTYSFGTWAISLYARCKTPTLQMAWIVMSRWQIDLTVARSEARRLMRLVPYPSKGQSELIAQQRSIYAARDSLAALTSHYFER